MQVERIDHLRDLQSVRADWNELAGDNPFRRFEWVASWWSAYSFGRELFVLLARDEQRKVVGIAPFYREHLTSEERIVRFLGDGPARSEYQSLLVHPNHIDETCLAFARWLASASPMHEHGWDRCELGPVCEGDLAIVELSRQLEILDVVEDEQDDEPCWCVDLPGTRDEFFANLNKSVRRKLQSLRRRYVPNQRAILRFAETKEEVDYGFDFLVQLHERRWQQVDVAGCFSQDGYEPFLHAVVRQFAVSGHLQLVQLEIDANVAAVSCTFTGNRRSFVYQCGVDPDQKEHQPGWLLNLMLLEKLIDDGIHQCDFLRGDERYKRDLNARPKPQVRLRLLAPHTRGPIWVAQRAFRSWGDQLCAAIRS